MRVDVIFFFFPRRPLRCHQPASGRENNRHQGDQRRWWKQPRLERSVPVRPAAWWHHSAATGLRVYCHAGRKYWYNPTLCVCLFVFLNTVFYVLSSYAEMLESEFPCPFFQGRLYTKSSVLGRVLIGCGASEAGQDHWKEMCSQGQTETARWHTIQSDVH